MRMKMTLLLPSSALLLLLLQVLLLLQGMVVERIMSCWLQVNGNHVGAAILTIPSPGPCALSQWAYR